MKNSWSLYRFMFKQDRISLVAWLLSVVSITVFTAVAFHNLYKTDVKRQEMAEIMRNPAMSAMVGPGYGLEAYTTGAMLAHQMLLLTAVVIAIMNILLVIRHTRTDEEEGRNELIQALPTGRFSSLLATFSLSFIINIALAVIIGIGLSSLQIESLHVSGSFLYGAVLGTTGILFAAITAIFAQLFASSRSANGFSFTTLGYCYLIRAVGDAGNETLSIFSPLGWLLKTEVYVQNYWWPIWITLGLAILFIIIALYLNSIRDMGAGFFSVKPGKTNASFFLQSPFGLLYRLQRTGLIAWAVGMFVLGSSYGSVLGDLDSFFADIEIMQELLSPIEGFSLSDQFIVMLMSVIAMIATIPVILTMLKIRSEEKKNRLDHLLSRAVSRAKLLGSSLQIAIIVSVLMLVFAVCGLWLAGNAAMEEGIAFSLLFQAAIVYLPAIWLMLGLTVLLIGFVPQFTHVIWFYLLYSFVVIYMGGLFQFPTWMSKLSPFGFIPQIPLEDFKVAPLLIVTFVAVILSSIGFNQYRNRDLVD